MYCYQQQQDMIERLLYFLPMADFIKLNMQLRPLGEAL